jgi:hypothetical protein
MNENPSTPTSPVAKAPRRPFRWLRLPAYFVATLATLVALVYAVENWRGDHAWAALQADLRAQGEKLTFGELLPAKPADDQNFAMTPSLVGLFDKPGFTNVINRLQIFRLPDAVSKGATNDLHGNLDALAEGMRESNRRKAKTPRNYENVVIFPVPEAKGDPAADVLAGMRPLEAGLAEIASALKRPASQFPIHFEDNFAALLPHLATLKGLQIDFGVRAMARLASGDTAGGFTDTLTGLQLPEVLRSEPILISQLVHLAMAAIALKPVHAGIIDHRWTDAQLAAFQEVLGKRDYMTAMVLAPEGERAFFASSLDWMIGEPATFIDMLGDSDRTGGELAWQLDCIKVGPHGWIRQNQVTGVSFESRIIAAARVLVQKPLTERYLGDFPPIDQRELPRTIYTRIANALVPAYPKSFEKSRRADTVNALALVACALERHHVAHGAYPDALAKIDARFLVRPPIDPLNGEPFHYAALPDGSFKLYSVGPNRKDDDGVFFRKGANANDLDWPWPPFKPDGQPTIF